jgi:hypothetical protein
MIPQVDLSVVFECRRDVNSNEAEGGDENEISKWRNWNPMIGLAHIGEMKLRRDCGQSIP